jgi:hypothetical protein
VKKLGLTRSLGKTMTRITIFQVCLYSKLFVLMGISWLSECVDAELHGDHSTIGGCDLFTEVLSQEN